MPTLPPEYEVEVERRVERRVKEQAQALELTGIGRELRSIKRWMAKTERRLDAANHLKEGMVTNERFDAFEDKLERQLGSFVTVEQLGDGDFVVHSGVVTTREQANEGTERRYRRREVWAGVAVATAMVVGLVVDIISRIR